MGFLQLLIKEHFVSESTLWANHLWPKIQGKLYWYFLAISPLFRCIFRTRARNNSLIRRLNQLSEMFLSEVVCFVCDSVTEVEGKSTKSGKTFPHILIGTYLTIFPSGAQCTKHELYLVFGYNSYNLEHKLAWVMQLCQARVGGFPGNVLVLYVFRNWVLNQLRFLYTKMH